MHVCVQIDTHTCIHTDRWHLFDFSHFSCRKWRKL